MLTEKTKRTHCFLVHTVYMILMKTNFSHVRLAKSFEVFYGIVLYKIYSIYRFHYMSCHYIINKVT